MSVFKWAFSLWDGFVSICKCKQVCLLSECRNRKVLFHIITNITTSNMEISDSPDWLGSKFCDLLNTGELHPNHILLSFFIAMSQVSSSTSILVKKLLIWVYDLSNSPPSFYLVICLCLLIVKFRSSPMYHFQRLLTLHHKFLTGPM